MKSYWSQLILAISEAFYPERKEARLAEKRADLNKEQAKKAEVKLRKCKHKEEPAGEVSLPMDRLKRDQKAK